MIGLQAFLLGFQTAKTAYSLPQDKDEQEFAGFQDWIVQRYNVQTSQSWAGIISGLAVDEADSLHLFFKLLAEYTDFYLKET
ncbi:hypothetical protein QUF63_10665 [Anaerolineales bacterium HSG25]|nr:hypothetical protein [Anaerolineales bacterium HSG25]